MYCLKLLKKYSQKWYLQKDNAGGIKMPITTLEWNRHRDNMHQSLVELLQRKQADPTSYEYTCQIMAFTFNLSTDAFMNMLENEDIYTLAIKLTADEYGEINYD